MTALLRAVAGLALVAAAAGCADTSPYARQPSAAAPAASEIAWRVLLAGDVGDDDSEPDRGDRQPALVALEAAAAVAPERTTIVYLGDLIYPHGLPAHGEGGEVERARRRLFNQIRAGGAATTVVIPGNHDWANGHAEGWENVRALGDEVRAVAVAEQRPVRVLPEGGCPGPTRLALGERADLIALDTHWWLHGFDKPAPEHNPQACPVVTEDGVLTALTTMLAQVRAEGRTAIVAAHHPLRTHGAHGGFFDWRAHLFPLTTTLRSAWIPLPGIGSLVALWRSTRSWMNQDLSHPEYAHLQDRLGDALARAAAQQAAPLLYAAGHDHNLQVLRDPASGMVHAVSGLGSLYQIMHVGHGDDTVFSHAQADRPGFMEVLLLERGAAQLVVHEVKPGTQTTEPVFRLWLAGEPSA